IFLTNTHLMSAYGLENDLYQKTRKEQVLEIIGILKDYKGIQLLVGDFNFQPDTSPFQEIIKAGFIDPTNKNIKTIKKRRLDYIFLKNLFPNSNTKLVLKDKNFSDHAGLIIEI
ncbi:hypothetical protein KKG15_01350, partial [Patescibacteria group bacterium]|nr:hypothetical protein [Patescibacteria group bacterium]